MYGSDCGLEIESSLLSGRSGLSNPPRMNAPENYLGVITPDEIERPHESLADEVCHPLIVLAKAEKPRRLRRIQKSGAWAIGRYFGRTVTQKDSPGERTASGGDVAACKGRWRRLF
jgi:hypothetical protein